MIGRADRAGASVPRRSPPSGPRHDRARRPAPARPDLFRARRRRPVLYSPLDDKPKRTDDPLALARVRDIRADPRVTVLVDRWDEDWRRLAWLRCDGRADLLEPSSPEHATIVAALRVKYPQYATHRLGYRPIIRIEIERVASWGALGPGPR